MSECSTPLALATMLDLGQAD